MCVDDTSKLDGDKFLNPFREMEKIYVELEDVIQWYKVVSDENVEFGYDHMYDSGDDEYKKDCAREIFQKFGEEFVATMEHCRPHFKSINWNKLEVDPLTQRLNAA
jgi:hypothetical protein